MENKEYKSKDREHIQNNEYKGIKKIKVKSENYILEQLGIRLIRKMRG